jgi:hypothetical protein
VGTQAQTPHHKTRPRAAVQGLAAGIAGLTLTASLHAATPPPWVAAITPGTWAAVSLNTMADVDPAKEPGLNPRAPSNAAWSAVEGQSGVLNDWNGGAFASGLGPHGSLLTFGGGHKGYYGSEVYAFDLGTQRWRRVTNPYAGPFSWPFANGTYPDGSPVPTHTYDYVDYHAATNSFVVLRGVEDGYQSTNATSRFVAHMLDLDTGQWRRSPVNSSPSLDGGGSSCYDPNRDVFWIMTPGTNRIFAKFEPTVANSNGTVGRYTNYTGDNVDIDTAADCDPIRDLYVYADFRNQDRVYARSLKDPAAARIQLQESGDIPTKEHGGGWAWSEKRQGFIYWRRGAGVFEFRPENTSPTGSWRWSNLTAGSNQISPPNMQADNGVYSRFRLASFGDEEVALIVNRVDGAVYAFRIPDGAMSTPSVSVSLAANPRTVNAGESTQLTWSSSNATSCTASGGWGGSRGTSGTATVGPVNASTTFNLDCSNTQGSSRRASVQVEVVTTSTPSNRAPTISGSAPTTTVAGQAYLFQPMAGDADGDSLTFTIANRPSWASFNATTGVLSGTPTDGNVGTTSGIVISVSDGSITASLAAFSISVTASSATYGGTISWVPPTTTSDGSPLTDLAGYTIYYGTSSRQYTQSIRVGNPGISSYYIDGLAPGTYYFAVAGFDSASNESALSNEASGTIRAPSSTSGGTEDGDTGTTGSGSSGGTPTSPPSDADPLTGGSSSVTPEEILVLSLLAAAWRSRQRHPPRSALQRAIRP